MKPKINDAPLSRRGLLARIIAAIVAMRGVPAAANQKQKAPAAAKWDDKFEVAIDFEIVQQEGFRSRRPYIAVFVEDKDGKPIRTIDLWVQTSRRGPRWIPDLRRWYRDDQDRLRTPGAPDLIATVSSATRVPGKYSLVWNGRDDGNKVVLQGDYTIYIEAVREHGTYQLMKAVVAAGAKPAKVVLEGNLEIKGATVEYRKRK